jgi:hypothetical protein
MSNMIDFSRASWSQIVVMLTSISARAGRNAEWAVLYVDRELVHEARKLKRFLNLEDYVGVAENRRTIVQTVPEERRGRRARHA